MHAPREVFEIDLMHDAYSRRHDFEGVERLHAPLHELVALGIALEFDLHVEIQGVARAVVVDLHRMIDDQVDRNQRLDQLGVSAHALRDASHRGEIAQQGHAGKVLKHDPGDDKRDFVGARNTGLPPAELADVVLGDFLAVAVAQYGFQHDAYRYRKARDLPEPGFFQRRQRIVLAGDAGRGAKLLQRIEKIMRHHDAFRR